MAFTNYIQQITATNGTTHDLVDTSASHYVKGTQTSSTNAWTGALPDGVSAYYDGLSIDYFLPYAGTSSAATLNLGSKGAKPVYVGNGTEGVTTHFPQYSVIHLTYIINSSLNSGNGCWKATSYYNTNDDYKVRTVARGTTKAYVLGTTTAPTSSNQNVTSVSETGVYLETSNSATRLIAPTFVGALTGTASGNLTSSSTLDATKLSGTIPSGCYTNTWNAMTGATSSANGTVGYINAAPPKDGYNTKYWRADGTWAIPPDNNTDTKVTSSANHYTPSTASGNDKTASASGATAAWSIDVVKGITINTDGKGHITGLSVTSGKIPANPNSDEKVKTIALTSGTTYYPILATGANAAANRQVDSTLGSFKYTVTAGTTSAIGKAFLEIGNNIASGTANNVKGILKIYGANSTAYLIDAQSETTASEVALILPDAGGTLLSSGCLNYTTSGNNRAVQRDSNGNLYVTQKDDNTTYSAGTGLSLSSTTFSVKTGFTTSGNSRKVQTDSNGNLYVIQKDTNTYVTQTGDSTATWRKVLGTYNGASAVTTTVSNATNLAYFDADGPAFNTSTGELYTKGYYMYLATNDALYTAINDLSWVDSVIS